MFRIVLTLLTMALLTACATSVSDKDLAATKRLGIVSNIGVTFSGTSIGTTMFNNSYFKASVPDWAVDTTVTSVALDLLGKQPAFSSAALDKSQLSPENLNEQGSLELMKVAEQQQFDKLLVIRAWVADAFPHFRPGAGFHERSLLGNAGRCVYVAYAAVIYDVVNKKRLASEFIDRPPCLVGTDNDIPFKEKFDDYSLGEKAVIKSRLEKRIAWSLQASLKSLALLPAAGAAQ